MIHKIRKFNNSKHHRTDGPAYINEEGRKWLINGTLITDDVEQWLAENNYTAFILKFI